MYYTTLFHIIFYEISHCRSLKRWAELHWNYQQSVLPSSGCDSKVPRLNVRLFPSFSFVSNFIVLFFSFSDSHSSFFSQPLMMLRGRIFSQHAPGERERYSNTYWCSQNISNNVQHSETHAVIVKRSEEKTSVTPPASFNPTPDIV